MTTLTTREEHVLAEYEQQVERGLSTFLDVGRALLAIRDERLYRSEHETFETYCRERWGMTDRYARNLMQAAEVGTTVPVQNEAQARELAPLLDQPERLRETWQQVNEQTAGKPTAAAIRSIVRPATVTTTASETVQVDTDTGEVLTEEEWREQEGYAPAAAVNAYLDGDADLQRTRLAANFARLISQTGTGLPLLDASAVADAINDDHWQTAVRLRRRLNDWFDALDASRPRGLRVVEG